MAEKHDNGGDAAAYVLGALEADELQAFRAHLATCATCRHEVAALEQAVDALPLAATQYEAPKQLRRRVLADVRAEPRQPEASRRRRSPRFRVPRPVVAVGVAGVLALAVVGVVELASGGSNGVRVISAHTMLASASAQIRLGDGRSELVVRNMPPPPAGHIYQVWLKRGSRPPSPTDALFSVSSTGAGTVGIPGSLKGVSEVLVTPERAGGSVVPSHAPVIVAALT
jgi:anti-sigma-K factor RskA